MINDLTRFFMSVDKQIQWNVLGDTSDSIYTEAPPRAAAIIIVVVFVVFMVGPHLYRSDYNLESSFQISTIGGFSDNPGQSVTFRDYNHSGPYVLFNETPDPNSNSWWSTTHPYWEDMPVMRPEIIGSYFDDTGFILSMEHAFIEFRTGMNLPVDDIESLNITFDVEVLSGEATVKLSLYRSDIFSPDSEHVPPEEIEMALTAGTLHTLKLSPNVSRLQDLTNHWLSLAIPRIGINVRDAAILRLGKLVVAFESDLDLVPVSIDIQSGNGTSFFDNRYSKWMRNRPILNLTRLSAEPVWAGARFMKSNEILLLRPGNYSGKVGWGYTVSYRWFDVDLVVEANTQVHWAIRLSCARLLVEVLPELASYTIRIDDVYEAVMPAYSNDEFFYLPVGDVSSSYSVTVEINRNEHFRVISSRIYALVSVSAGQDLQITTQLPLLTAFGFAFTISDIVSFVCIVLASSVVVVWLVGYFRSVGWFTLRRDPRFWSFVLLSLSLVIPWSLYSVTVPYFNGPQTTMHYWNMQPWATYFWQGEASQILPMPAVAILAYPYKQETGAGQFYIILTLLLFWIPYAYSTSRIGRGDWEVLDPSYLWSVVAPSLLSILMMVIPRSGHGHFVGFVGSYLVFAALGLWLAAHFWRMMSGRRRRTTAPLPDQKDPL
jgi:hypothetical protein